MEDFEKMSPTDHPKVMRLSASIDVTEAEILRLIEELAALVWEDADELRRRIHLVSRRYSLEAEGVSADREEQKAP